jgi:hypothetical protein
MQQSLFDTSTTETLQDRMGYSTLNFSIQDIAEMNERDWSKYIARLKEINQMDRRGEDTPGMQKAGKELYQNWTAEDGKMPPDDLCRLKLAFGNNQYAKDAIEPIQKALQSTPCYVIWPYAGKSDGGYGSTLHVIGTEEWLRGAKSILKDLQDGSSM